MREQAASLPEPAVFNAYPAIVNALAQVPANFLYALGTLRKARCRSELRLDEIPAPARLAPFAVALGAEVIIPSGGKASSPVDR